MEIASLSYGGNVEKIQRRYKVVNDKIITRRLTGYISKRLYSLMYEWLGTHRIARHTEACPPRFSHDSRRCAS